MANNWVRFVSSSKVTTDNYFFKTIQKVYFSQTANFYKKGEASIIQENMISEFSN